MTTVEKQIITWSQPEDDMAKNVVMVDGIALDPATNSVERQRAVAVLTSAAEHGQRIALQPRGWKTDSAIGIAAQLPVACLTDGVLPSVAVFVPTPALNRLDAAVTQVVQTAELAGYTADAASVRAQLAVPSPRPKGLLARLWAWIRSLFGR